MTVDELIKKLEPFRGFTIEAVYWDYPNIKDVSLSVGDVGYPAKQVIIGVEDVKED